MLVQQKEDGGLKKKLELAARLDALPNEKLAMVIIMNWRGLVLSGTSEPFFKIPLWYKFCNGLCDAVSSKDCDALRFFVKEQLDFKLEIRFFKEGGEDFTKIPFTVFRENTLLLKGDFIRTTEGAGDLIRQILMKFQEYHSVYFSEGKVIHWETA